MQRRAIRSWRYDREHQLDRVIVNGFNKKNDTDLESVKIIYGPGANEYTRSRHALALVVADRIYFRNGAYKPETEEGRKLLAHELTHIAQNRNCATRQEKNLRKRPSRTRNRQFIIQTRM